MHKADVAKLWLAEEMLVSLYCGNVFTTWLPLVKLFWLSTVMSHYVFIYSHLGIPQF
jgi:hypothetical protein